MRRDVALVTQTRPAYGRLIEASTPESGFVFRLAFPPKVASDTPFLSSLQTDLSEIWYTFDLILGEKATKMFAKSVHRQLR